MNAGHQFDATLPDGDVYRVIYTDHFARRFDTDAPDHPAVKRTITEETIRAKVEEAIPKIDDVIYGKSMKGVIVSRSAHFIMLFEALETRYGRQLNMLTLSGRIAFKSKSAKEVVIEVNPTFSVMFSVPLSTALKTSILADLAINWPIIESGVLYHLGGEISDYWIERSENTFHVPMADWTTDLIEVEVS